MTSESAPAGQFHWTTRCLELAAVAPEPKLRQRFLRMARSFQVDVALLANSRVTIAESRRLLATVEHSASGIQGYKARHREATMVPARQIALDVAELGAETGLDSAALSVRVFQEGAQFNWTVCDPDKHLLGRGTADTELKARTDAFRAGMTYLCWLKDQPAPKDASVH